ncbi:MAG: hypothetical protein ACE3JP_01550 [Ectobacillus sp.]
MQNYDIDDFVAQFNDLAKPFALTMQNPTVYEDNANFIVFSIPVSNGCGVGITADKQSGMYTNLAIVGSATSYTSFFDTVFVILKQIDSQLTTAEANSILQQLGEGKPAEQINGSLSFENAALSLKYEAQSNLFIFEYTAK